MAGMKRAGCVFLSLASVATLGAQITPSLLVTPASVSLTAVAQADEPLSQAIAVITADGSLFDFQVEIDGGAPGVRKPDWLLVNATRATTPARLLVGASTAGLAAGDYGPARLQITTSRGVLMAPPIPVALRVVRAAPRLEVAPEVLRFNGRIGGPVSLEQPVLVRNTGSGGIAAGTVMVTGSAAWLRPAVETCAGDCLVRVSVALPGLQPGLHRAVLRIATELGAREVPVALYLADRGPLLELYPPGLQLDARAGHGTREPRQISVLNSGEAKLNWTAEIASGRQWLSLSPASGTAAPGSPGTIELAADTSTLAPGAHYALIKVATAEAPNSPQYAVFVLRVADATAPPAPAFSPAGLLFTATSGAAPPASQPVTLFLSNSASIPYQSFAQVNQGMGTSWLSVTPSRAEASTSAPAPLHVATVPTNLPPGVYTGDVVVSLGSPLLRVINVTLAVRPPGDTCSPATLAAVHTALPDSFETRTGVPTRIGLRLANDCGQPVANALVAVTFSNGDPALALRHAGDGLYTGVWVPRGAASWMSLTARAWATGLPGLGTTRARLHGAVLENSAPVLAPNGTLHTLNPQVGAALAPGTIAQIFGADLAAATAQPPLSGGRLPTSFTGSSVIVGESAAPLYYLSGGQINAQIPVELPPGRPYPILVNVRGAYTLPDSIYLVPVQPGVAAFPDGRVVAQDAGFRLIDAGNPARRGDYIVIYLAGMGLTNPMVASGLQTPSLPPLAEVVARPQVSIDGQPAEVVFAGLTPASVGLYQINVRVPADVRTGDLKLLVSQGGVTANETVLPVR